MSDPETIKEILEILNDLVEGKTSWARHKLRKLEHRLEEEAEEEEEMAAFALELKYGQD